MPTELDFDSPKTLAHVARNLPEADETPIFWDDPLDGSDFEFHEQIDEYKAVYNPETGELYSVVSDEYTIINPETFLLPLVEEIEERDRTDVRGHFRVYNGGARAYGELLFDTDAIWPPGRDDDEEPVRTGLNVNYSHDGGVSVSAAGFAQDGVCTNTMRRVTDSVYIKHAGDVGDRVDWNAEWGAVLDQVGVFSERLADVIASAMEVELFDLAEHEFSDEWIDVTDPNRALDEVPSPAGVTDAQMRGLHGLYDYLGFPNYLALGAVDRLSWRLMQTDTPTVVTAWDGYQAATYALSHQARFESGSSADDDYHRYASDLLMNPLLALESAGRELRSRIETDAGEEGEPLAIETTVGEAVQSYQEREEDLRASLQN